MKGMLAWVAPLALLACAEAPPVARLDAGVWLRVDASAPPPGCSDAPPLELGRCLDRAGAPCTSTETSAQFALLEERGTLAPVVGPQGSTMFPMAARTSGIAPGLPDEPFSTENPILELTLSDESGHLVTVYRGRAGFRAVPGSPDTFEQPQLYVIVDEPSVLLRGRTFLADAVLRDAEGRERCGNASFVSP